MSEADAVKNSLKGPVTIDSLIYDLQKLGVYAGMTLLVHSSLSSIGWVCGSSVSVIQALESILTVDGTLVMPTHSSDLSDPSQWQNPPVEKAWWQTIRDTMPAFSPDVTPTRGMGKIPESFRKQDGVIRSNHPQHSFSAWGKNAEHIAKDHTLNYGMGEGSPLAKIYDLDGYILLLGVSHDSNSSLHLSEFRANYKSKAYSRNGAPITIYNIRKWVELEDIASDYDDFSEIGKAYENSENPYSKGLIGNASSILIPQKYFVDFAVKWMEANRS